MKNYRQTNNSKNLSIIKSLETNICHILVDQDGLEYERAKQDFENQPENILTQEEINALYQGNNS